MKIAFVGGFAWEPLGTIKLRAFPIAVELARLGHEVAIFLPPYDNRSYSGKQFESEGVKLANIPQQGLGLYDLCRSKRLARFLVGVGVPLQLIFA
jgi:hypothetical protein